MEQKSKYITFMALCSNPAIRIRMVHSNSTEHQAATLHDLMSQLKGAELRRLKAR